MQKKMVNQFNDGKGKKERAKLANEGDIHFSTSGRSFILCCDQLD